LFESELFGHNKGAFTDARTDKPGRLELAYKGTLFLDEIANITLQQQQKLLQLIQERKFSRLGSNEEIQSEFRLICATNRNLKELVRSGEFRQDLYYRINTLELNVPPLRERKGDIIRLATHFADHFSKKYNRSFKEFEEETMSRLINYSWPGNVRELSHVIEKAVILSNSNSLSIDIIETKEMTNDNTITNLSDLERLTIQKVIDKNEGNLTVSAKELGISRSTLYLKIEKYDIH
jgi:transcriptional regulator with PAS, ATPase and Fis domain